MVLSQLTLQSDQAATGVKIVDEEIARAQQRAAAFREHTQTGRESAQRLISDLSDWYMHAAMYAVILSFLVIYVKAHRLGKRVSRAFYALVTLGLIAFFAWVLDDMVPVRALVENSQRLMPVG